MKASLIGGLMYGSVAIDAKTQKEEYLCVPDDWNCRVVEDYQDPIYLGTTDNCGFYSTGEDIVVLSDSDDFLSEKFVRVTDAVAHEILHRYQATTPSSQTADNIRDNIYLRLKEIINDDNRHNIHSSIEGALSSISKLSDKEHSAAVEKYTLYNHFEKLLDLVYELNDDPRADEFFFKELEAHLVDKLGIDKVSKMFDGNFPSKQLLKELQNDKLNFSELRSKIEDSYCSDQKMDLRDVFEDRGISEHSISEYFSNHYRCNFNPIDISNMSMSKNTITQSFSNGKEFVKHVEKLKKQRGQEQKNAGREDL